MGTKVSESTGYGPNREMSVIGYLAAALILLLLLPILPFALVAWLLWRIFASDDEEPVRRSWKRKGRRSQP